MEKNTPENRKESFEELYKIIKQLRHPEEGCPWDLKQNPRTMRNDLIEEAYECIDAIDNKDNKNLKEELGDLFLILLMITGMKEEEKAFSLVDVLNEISEKLVRRHPHVFGEGEAENAEEVVKQWDYIKENVEGKKNEHSIMERLPSSLPPLDRAHKIQKRAAKVGFEWDELGPVWDKLEEELKELRHEYESGHTLNMEQEMGDVLFSVVNLARMMKIDSSLALNRTNNKFISRFQKMEAELIRRGIDINSAELPLMDSIWDEIKVQEKQQSKE